MNFVIVFGYLAAIATTCSFVPQALKTIRTRDTSGISLSMYVLYSFGASMWLAYGIGLHDPPMIISNSIILILSLIIMGYKMMYK